MHLLKKNIAFLLLLAAIVAASQFIYVQLNAVYLGIDVAKTADGKWHVAAMDNQGWAAKHNVQVGDRVMLIDGQDPSLHPTVKFNSIEQAKDIQFMRADQTYTLHVQNDELSGTNDSYIAPTTLFIFMFGFSVLLFWKKRQDSSATLLILFFLTLALTYLAGGSSSVREPFAQVFIVTSLPLVPVIFLHFLYDYFRKLQVQVFKPQTLWLLYGIIALIFVLDVGITFTDLGYVLQHTQMSLASLLLFSLGVFLMIFVLSRGYVKHRHTIYNPLFKYMIAGNVISFFPFILFYALPLVLFRFPILPAAFAAMFILLSPVVYVYLIVSKQLMDINFIIGRLKYYCVIAVAPTAMVVGLLMIVAGYNVVSFLQWLQYTLYAYMGFVGILYGMGSLEFRTKRPLLGSKMTFQHSLNRFTEEIAKVTRHETLEEKLVNEVVGMLPVTFAAIVESGNRTQQVIVRKSHGTVPDPSSLSFRDKKDWAFRIGEVIEVPSGIIMLIGKKQQAHYMLWLGQKENRVRFNPDELVWLRTIANYVGIVYENLEMMSGMISEIDIRGDKRSPSWVSRLLFLLAEKERRRLAADLHDSALQDQLLWYRRFTDVLADLQLPADTRQRMLEIKEGMLDVVHQIRQTCNELRPPFLRELGAAEAINQVCDYAALNANFSVHFDHRRFHLALNDEYVLTLYRVTQELLRNTMKHANATEVKLRLYNDGSNILYEYRDNGVGMDMLRMKSSFRHMGLSGIRERISGLDGETVFRTSEGNGFEVTVSLPYREHVQVGI